jgi:hypothetical protein
MRVTYLHRARTSAQESQSPKLQDLLFKYRGFGATDLRDKVYALIGLAHDAYDLTVVPNYKIETALYPNVALQILMNSRNLNLLSVPHVPGPYQAGELPSWVPDWNATDFTIPLVDDTGDYFKFRALPQDGRFPLETTDDANTIGLSGDVLDLIVEVGDPLEPSDHLPFLQGILNIPQELAIYYAWKNIACGHAAKLNI